MIEFDLISKKKNEAAEPSQVRLLAIGKYEDGQFLKLVERGGLLSVCSRTGEERLLNKPKPSTGEERLMNEPEPLAGRVLRGQINTGRVFDSGIGKERSFVFCGCQVMESDSDRQQILRICHRLGGRAVRGRAACG